jgi:hypothetical protein
MEVRSAPGERTRIQPVQVRPRIQFVGGHCSSLVNRLSNQEVIPAPRLPNPMPKMEEAKPTLDSLVKKEDPTKFYINIKPIGEG